MMELLLVCGAQVLEIAGGNARLVIVQGCFQIQVGTGAKISIGKGGISIGLCGACYQLGNFTVVLGFLLPCGVLFFWARDILCILPIFWAFGC